MNADERRTITSAALTIGDVLRQEELSDGAKDVLGVVFSDLRAILEQPKRERKPRS